MLLRAAAVVRSRTAAVEPDRCFLQPLNLGRPKSHHRRQRNGSAYIYLPRTLVRNALRIRFSDESVCAVAVDPSMDQGDSS